MRRMASLAVPGPSRLVGHGDITHMHCVYRFRKRLCHERNIAGCARPRGLKVARYIVPVAVYTIDRSSTADSVRYGILVLTLQEGGFVTFVVEFEDIDRDCRETRHIFRNVGIVILPVGILLVEKRQTSRPR